MTKKKKRKTNLTKAIIISLLVLIISIVGIYYSINNLKFGLDLQGGFEVLYQVDSIDESKVTTDMVNSTYKIINKRINALGVSEPEISIEGDNIRVTMAGVDNIEDAIEKLSNLER